MNSNKKTKILFIVLPVLIVSALAVLVVYNLKEYTRKNTWVDLEVEVHTSSQGTTGTRADKKEEMLGLMAGDSVPIVPGCEFKIIEIHPNGDMVLI